MIISTFKNFLPTGHPGSGRSPLKLTRQIQYFFAVMIGDVDFSKCVAVYPFSAVLDTCFGWRSFPSSCSDMALF